MRKDTLFAIQFSGNFKLFDGLRADIVVRGNYGQKLSDLEILGIVEFMLFSVIRGPWGSIFVECQFFYPVAFFLGRGGDIARIRPKMGGLRRTKMKVKYEICIGNGHKKSHWAKKMAFGRNDAPRAPVNQKQQKLDYA